MSPRSSPPRVSEATSSKTSKNAFSAPLGSMPSPQSRPSQSAINIPSPDLRAALVRQWCFAEGSPPTPSVFDGPIVDSDATPPTGDFRGVVSAGSPGNDNNKEKSPMYNPHSPPSEKGYAWWISGGRISYAKSDNVDGLFAWSGGELPLPPSSGNTFTKYISQMLMHTFLVERVSVWEVEIYLVFRINRDVKDFHFICLFYVLDP
jgi:hypothetical protein